MSDQRDTLEPPETEAKPAVQLVAEPASSLGSRMLLEARGWRHAARGNGQLLLGISLLGVVVITTLFAPLIARHSPVHPDVLISLLPPSAGYWFGTDGLGFDVFSRVIYAPRIDLVIPVVATAVSFTIGVPIGAWVGFYSGESGVLGFVSEQFMRALDVLQAFPVFVLALALVATLGRSSVNVVYALIVLEAPVFVRLTRSSVQAVRTRAFVDAAKVAGSSELRVIFRHIMPNSVGPSLVQASVLTGQGIMITAALSFIGAGVQPPTPEWGAMVSEGAQSLVTGQWWPAVFPGTAIAITVLGFALVGEALTNPARSEGRH